MDTKVMEYGKSDTISLAENKRMEFHIKELVGMHICLTLKKAEKY
jgi:hypothetical protein